MAKHVSRLNFRQFLSLNQIHPLAQRERWTQDITGLMAVVIFAAAVVLGCLVLVGIFAFQETVPIYVVLAFIVPAWWASYHGGWRWAALFPGLLCFSLGVYSSILDGFYTVSVLFYAISVLLTGMLQSSRGGFLMVFVSTAAYFGIGMYHGSIPTDALDNGIVFFFILFGVSLLQWYTYSHLQHTLEAQIEATQSLKAEIARREQIETVQREQETQLRRLADNMTDLVAEMDPNGLLRYVSPSYQAVLGHPLDGLLGANIFDLVHPEDQQLARDSIAAVAANRSPRRIQLRARHLDGHYIDFEVTGNTLYAANGDLTGFVINSREITLQKIAENAIQESEKKFRNIIESLPLGIHMYTLEEDGSLIFSGYNPAAEAILAIDHARLLQLPIEIAFPGLAASNIPDRFKQIAREGGIWKQEQLDDSTNPVAGAFEVHAFQTSPGKLVSVFADITGRIRAAEALRFSEEKFSTAFVTSPDSININRLADGVYIDINLGFTNIMGYTREDVIGKSSLELNIWVDPADRARLVKGLLEKGEVNNLEARFQNKSGEIIIGLMSARVIQIQGEKCILSITRDVTQRIQAEWALRDAHSRLEQAYEATLQGWARALELRERETADHSRRVVELTMRMAEALGIVGDELVYIRRGALLHDIGKMGIPDGVLLKPGQLTADEWVTMRKHTTFAKAMLGEIDYLRPSITIPFSHHEKWDGSGYPLGLKGEDIPLAARIFAVVDVYDALTHDRPYRPAWSEEEACRHLLQQKGIHFDPNMVDVFLTLS